MASRTGNGTRNDEEVIDLTGDADDRHRARTRSGGEERGRGAESPSDIPAAGWKDVGLRVKDQIKEDLVPLMAGGVAFYLLLALFPALVALVSIYGLVADPAEVSEQVADATTALPESARELITEQLESIADGAGGGLGLAVIGGVLAALWSASSGMKHLIGAVNAAYDERETRKFLKLRGLSLAMTVGAVLFTGIALGVVAVLPAMVDRLPLGVVGQVLVQVGSFVLLAGAFVVALAVLYRYAPDRDAPKWRWVSWGAVIATAIWIIASIGFSFYVANFGNFGEAYGSIGAVIVLMLWLMITAFTIILGAEIDSELEAQTAKDSTTGEAQPMGQRGAEKADNLGHAAAAD
jgi:membrane protein